MALAKEQVRVSMGDPNKLKEWVEASGRKYILLNASDLIDALDWPEGCIQFQRLIESYREYRSTLPTGRTERQQDPKTRKIVEVSITKAEVLEPEEKLELFEQLRNELVEAGVLQ